MKIVVEALFETVFEQLKLAQETEDGDFGISLVKDISSERPDSILVDLDSGISLVVNTSNGNVTVEGDTIQGELLQKIIRRSLINSNISVKVV